MSIQNQVPASAQRRAMSWQWARQASESWSSPSWVGLMESSIGPTTCAASAILLEHAVVLSDDLPGLIERGDVLAEAA